jgi:ubiquinone biosynthesis protein
MHLDKVGTSLDPQFDPNDAVRRKAAEILEQRVTDSLSPGRLFITALETKDFMQRFPSRINKILDAVANNDLRVHVDAIDENQWIEGIQKVANRITMGLILCALIIGAAMLMQVDTTFRVFGYPGFAMILFLMAAAGGVMLCVDILYYDRGYRPKKGRRQ